MLHCLVTKLEGCMAFNKTKYLSRFQSSQLREEHATESKKGFALGGQDVYEVELCFLGEVLLLDLV